MVIAMYSYRQARELLISMKSPFRHLNEVLGSKTELVFSRQGFSYQTGSVTGKVNLDYIVLPTYICINSTKYFQIQLRMPTVPVRALVILQAPLTG